MRVVKKGVDLEGIVIVIVRGIVTMTERGSRGIAVTTTGSGIAEMIEIVTGETISKWVVRNR